MLHLLLDGLKFSNAFHSVDVSGVKVSQNRKECQCFWFVFVEYELVGF